MKKSIKGKEIKIKRIKRSTLWMSLLRCGEAEKLSFPVTVSGGFAHCFENKRK